MVSVIIPAYNYGQFIAATLQSLLDQTYSNFECLIIDNGSTDNTEIMVQPFLSDKRFKYYKQLNLGVSGGRNRGLKEAQGDYIQFLDADDLLESKKLEAGVNVLELNNHIDLVYSDMRYFKSEEPGIFYYSFTCNAKNDSPWMKNIGGAGKLPISQLLEGNNFVISSPIFRSKILTDTGVFDESLMYNEDWEFWLRIVLQNKFIEKVNGEQTKTLIRIHNKSASNNIFRMQLNGLKVLLKHKTSAIDHGVGTKWESRVDDHVVALRRSLLQAKGDILRERLFELEQSGLDKMVTPFKFNGSFIHKLFLRINLLFN